MEEGTIVRTYPGQLLIVGFDGTEASPSLLHLIRSGQIGGVVLFSRNLRDPQQIRQLTWTLQETSRLGGHPPLFIAIDQEGGTVRRLRDRYVPLPSPMAIAASGLMDEARELIVWSCQEMASLGINQNYAPVLDINTNPLNPIIGTRAFSDDPDTVARWGQMHVQATLSGGILPSGKHFPGHGDTLTDSHHALAVAVQPRDRLEAVEWLPFKAAIGAGLPALMVGHIAVTAEDAAIGRPSSLSPVVLKTVIRDSLGFSGLIITDALDMAPIRDGVGIVNGTVAAITAGADQVVLAHALDQVSSLVARLTSLATFQPLAGRIRESSTRILETRERIRPRLEEVDYHRAHQLARHIWQSAIAGHGRVDRLPILDPVTVVTFGRPGRTDADDTPAEMTDPLSGAFGTQLHRHLRLPMDPSPAEIDEAWRRAQGTALIVVLNHALAHPGQYAAALRPAPQGPVAVIARTSPYDLRRLPPGLPGLTAFDGSPETAAPLVSAIRGDYPLKGRWPIHLEVRS